MADFDRVGVSSWQLRPGIVVRTSPFLFSLCFALKERFRRVEDSELAAIILINWPEINKGPTRLPSYSNWKDTIQLFNNPKQLFIPKSFWTASNRLIIRKIFGLNSVVFIIGGGRCYKDYVDLLFRTLRFSRTLLPHLMISTSMVI